MNKPRLRLPAEWEQQAAILIAWPHKDTDWDYILDEVEKCYMEVAEAITTNEDLIIVSPHIDLLKEKLSHLPQNRIHLYQMPTNDTWARDFGPISVISDGVPALYDFKFNAWGLKFAACHDNRINSNLFHQGTFNCKLVNRLNFVLEGGSIESDGHGTLLTTAECLLSPNRNGEFSKQDIEAYLSQQFGLSNIIWLNHGYLEGDDTDSHIDTLARLCPNATILYVGCDNPGDSHFTELKLMEKELMQAVDAQGKHFRCIKLPFPDPIYDENGLRLPATYANFLVTNSQVLVPIYGQPDKDAKALKIIESVFTERKVIGIDCRPLIKQHGSLHCITMQLITGTI